MSDLPPGFVDVQVNGFGGVSFSDPGLSPADIRGVSAALAERGVAGFCPTVITAAWDTYPSVLPMLAAAAGDESLPCRVLGIHLEGPFISPEVGAVGAHPKQHTRPPSIADFEALYRLAQGQVRLLTLAPELPGAPDLIRHAAGRGVAVSIGHSLADARAIHAAAAAGARLSTHLGNGLPNLIHRHANPLWAQIAHPELTAMLITDGHHLPPDLIAAVLAAKGPARVIVTSDAAPAAGLPPGEYAFFGTRARLDPPAEGQFCGRLRNLEADTLAGSSATLRECAAYLDSLHLLDEAGLRQVTRENALRMVGQ